MTLVHQTTLPAQVRSIAWKFLAKTTATIQVVQGYFLTDRLTRLSSHNIQTWTIATLPTQDIPPQNSAPRAQTSLFCWGLSLPKFCTASPSGGRFGSTSISWPFNSTHAGVVLGVLPGGSLICLKSDEDLLETNCFSKAILKMCYSWGKVTCDVCPFQKNIKQCFDILYIVVGVIRSQSI